MCMRDSSISISHKSQSSQLPEQCQLNALVDHIITFAALNSDKGHIYNNEESRKAFEGAIIFCSNTLGPGAVPPFGDQTPQKIHESLKGSNNFRLQSRNICQYILICSSGAIVWKKHYYADFAPFIVTFVSCYVKIKRWKRGKRQVLRPRRRPRGSRGIRRRRNLRATIAAAARGRRPRPSSLSARTTRISGENTDFWLLLFGLLVQPSINGSTVMRTLNRLKYFVSIIEGRKIGRGGGSSRTPPSPQWTRHRADTLSAHPRRQSGTHCTAGQTLTLECVPSY